MGLFGNFFGKGDEPANVESVSGFPFEVFKVSGRQALQTALRWREEWRGNSSPVILGSTDLDRLKEGMQDSEGSATDLIELSKGIDLVEWFQTRLRENHAEGENDPLEYVRNPENWNMKVGPLEITSVREVLSRKIFSSVFIARIPTPNAFETPAHLKLGGWNECPASEEHVAVWKYWQEKFGAELLCATGDVIEATVERPPRSKEDCYTLAWEQFAYCSDIVTQGVGSVDALAATVRNGKYWYFWWD